MKDARIRVCCANACCPNHGNVGEDNATLEDDDQGPAATATHAETVTAIVGWLRENDQNVTADLVARHWGGA